jgi:hypothetical protein
MLIEPSESDDSFKEEDAVIVDNQIQTGWNTVDYDGMNEYHIDSGILIVPSFQNDRVDNNNDIVVTTKTTLMTKNNNNNSDLQISVETLSIPSSIPTTVLNCLPDGNLSISGIFHTNNSAENSMSITNNVDDCSVVKKDVKKWFPPNVRNILVGKNRLIIVVFVVVSLLTTIYVLTGSWTETTTKLEETIRELQAVEQRTAKIHQEQSIFLNQLLSRLQEEEKAKQVEKEKAEALEVEVLRLQQEIVDLDKEGKRAKELDEMIVQLRRDAEIRAKENERTTKMEQEVKRLQIEMRKQNNKKNRCDNASFSSDTKPTNFPWESSAEDSTTKLLDNCWLHSDVRMELGDCGRRTRDTISQQFKDWGDSIWNAQERIKIRMAQDYNDLKEMFHSHEKSEEKESSRSSSSSSSSMNGDKEQSNFDNNNEGKSERKEKLIGKMWRDLSDTLSNAQVRVMQQMANDYSDVMDFFNDVSSGNLFQQDNNNNVKMDNNKKVPSIKTTKEKESIPKASPPLKHEKRPSTGETKPSVNNKEDKKDEKVPVDSIKESVKSILYSVAYASIATAAVDYAGSWFSTLRGNDMEE